MPGWSPEIANTFIRLGATEARSFDQLQLQGFVYIAHGWCLAVHGKPLTGDRPEAWEYGPMYRRLADALVNYGTAPVTREILNSEAFMSHQVADANHPAQAELENWEAELIEEIYQNFGSFESWELSALTRKGDTPWKRIYADGAGKYGDIPHNLVKAQFVELRRQSQARQPSGKTIAD